MQFDFQTAINTLNQGLPFGDNFAYRIARATVVPGDYLLNTILPQEERPTYHVSGGNMTFTPTMLGQVPMDTPYPPMGAFSTSQFFENTTKLGGQMYFPEAKLRELQEFAQNLFTIGIRDGLSIGQARDAEAKRVAQTVIGFANMMLKAHWDTYEWLRGKALSKGLINWQYGKIELDVNYDIPAENKRSNSGTSSYYHSASKWWDDVKYVYRKLMNPRFIMNSNTYYDIVENSVNQIEEIDTVGMNRQIRRYQPANVQQGNDRRERMTVTIYDKSGSVINGKTGALTAVPFLADGDIIVVGEQTPDGFELMQGATPDPDNTLRLGYTHIAPTVEGGRMGIWSRVFTPEQKPYALQGETAANVLPVILNPNRLMILSTAMKP